MMFQTLRADIVCKASCMRLPLSLSRPMHIASSSTHLLNRCSAYEHRGPPQNVSVCTSNSCVVTSGFTLLLAPSPTSPVTSLARICSACSGSARHPFMGFARCCSSFSSVPYHAILCSTSRVTLRSSIVPRSASQGREAAAAVATLSCVRCSSSRSYPDCPHTPKASAPSAPFVIRGESPLPAR
jgi:hypothetical protein